MVREPVTLMSLKKASIVNDSFSRKQFDDLITDIIEYADLHNAVVQKQKKAYKIIKLKQSKVEIGLSYEKGIDSKFTGDFTNQYGIFNEGLMKWMNGKKICPWTMNEKKEDSASTNRTKTNAIESHMICFDFERQIDKDTGEIFEMTIDDAKEIFSKYSYILRTSKSHMIEDKGNRFHIYIPYKHVMDLDADIYKETYLNIAKKLGILNYIDKSTSHRASYFAESDNPAIMEFNDGIQLDYRCCIMNTKQADSIEKNHIMMEDIEFNNYRLRMYLEKVLNDINEGNRDTSINAFVHIAKNKIQADDSEIRAALDVISNTVVFDSSFTRGQMTKFYKRVGG
jgi:hypothetical protein